MNEIIVTTREELKEVIFDAVGSILPQLADFRRKNEAIEKDALNVTEAIQFISEHGKLITRNSLYWMTHKGVIPYKKIGRNTVFSKRELLKWIEQHTTYPKENK